MYHTQERCDRHRNYNCRIREADYNGVRQISLDNELLHVAVLAGKGSDITEFVYKPLDLDFMWHNWNGVQNPKEYVCTKSSADGRFLDLYEGGWQELFPSYGGCACYEGAEFGIHGEVCVPAWDYTVVTDTQEEVCVKLWVRTSRTPYMLEKWLTLKLGDPTLYIRERVTNEGGTPMQFMWGHHPALGPPFLDDSCIIRLPEGGQVQVLNSTGALAEGTAGNWPVVPDKDGNHMDLSRVQHQDGGRYREYGVAGLKEGSYQVWNQNLGIGFGMNWDLNMFPYLWVWEPGGSSPGYPWYRRNYTLGMEPWSHLASNLEKVVQRNEGIPIPPGQSIETQLTAFVCLER